MTHTHVALWHLPPVEERAPSAVSSPQQVPGRRVAGNVDLAPPAIAQARGPVMEKDRESETSLFVVISSCSVGTTRVSWCRP